MSNVEVTGLELNVNANVGSTGIYNLNKLANALSKIDAAKPQELANKVRQIQGALKGLDLKTTAASASELNKALSPLADTMQKIGKTKINIKIGGQSKVRQATNDVKALGKEIEKVSAEATRGGRTATGGSLASQYPTGTIKGTAGLSGIIGTTKAGGWASVKDFFSRGIKTTGLYNALSAVERLGGGLNNLARSAGKAGVAMASFARGPLSMVFNPFKGLSTTIQDATKRFSKFLGRLKRIAIYRAIRTALKELSQALREGINNLYQWSKIRNGDFAAAMDQIATAALYAKDSLAAMVSPIITYLAPAIDALTDKFVALLNVINQFFAKVTGRATWTEALKYPTEYAEAAAGATKKVKDNIQDFDELHILRTPSGGRGGNNLDYNNLFRESEFTNEFTDWIRDFKNALKSEQFYEAGAILSEAVNNLFEKRIDWSGIGTKLGTKITDTFHFAIGFLQNFHFESVGSGLATFLNNAIGNIDTNAVGAVFAYKIKSAVDIAYGFITTADWAMYGRKLSGFVEGWFETIDGQKIGRTITAAIHGALDFVEGFLQDDYKLNLLAEDIAGLINGIDWYGILTRTLKIGTKIVEAIFKVITDVLTGSTGQREVSQIFESTTDWRIAYETRRANGRQYQGGRSDYGSTLVTGIANSINTAANSSALADAFENLLITAWDGAVNLVKFMTDKLAEKIGQGIMDAWEGYHVEYDANGNIVIVPADESSPHMRAANVAADLLETGGLQVVPFLQEYAKNPNQAVSNLGSRYAKNPLLNYSKNPFIPENVAQTMADLFEIVGPGVLSASSVYNPITDWRINPFAATGIGVNARGRRRQGTPNANLLSQRYNKVPDYTSSAKSMLAYHEATKKQEYTLSELYKLSETSAANMATHWEDSAAKIESKVTGRFENTRLKIGATISDLTSDSTTKFDALGTAMSQSLDGVASAMVTPLNNIKGQITGAFAEAGQVTKDDIGNLSEVMTTSLKGVYDASAPEVEKVNSLWGSLHTNMKTTGNGIIDISEKVGNSIIDAFNAMGEGLKNYNGITFPDGRKIDLGSIKTVNHLAIPRLAEGGLVSSPTVAMVGEAGREAILPLDNNTAWMDALAERIGADGEEVALLREQNDLLRQIAAKKTGITTKEVFDAVRSENRDYFVSTGKNALVM